MQVPTPGPRLESGPSGDGALQSQGPWDGRSWRAVQKPFQGPGTLIPQLLRWLTSDQFFPRIVLGPKGLHCQRLHPFSGARVPPMAGGPFALIWDNSEGPFQLWIFLCGEDWVAAAQLLPSLILHFLSGIAKSFPQGTSR